MKFVIILEKIQYRLINNNDRETLVVSDRKLIYFYAYQTRNAKLK